MRKYAIMQDANLIDPLDGCKVMVEVVPVLEGFECNIWWRV
jgi:hypothetical protein